MKQILISLTILLGAAAAYSADLLNCTVTTMFDYTVFEESLSEEEYPYISIEEENGVKLAYIGMSRFAEVDGDVIVFEPVQDYEISWSIYVNGWNRSIHLTADGSTGEGFLTAGDDLIAAVVCR